MLLIKVMYKYINVLKVASLIDVLRNPGPLI